MRAPLGRKDCMPFQAGLNESNPPVAAARPSAWHPWGARIPRERRQMLCTVEQVRVSVTGLTLLSTRPVDGHQAAQGVGAGGRVGADQAGVTLLGVGAHGADRVVHCAAGRVLDSVGAPQWCGPRNGRKRPPMRRA